MIWWQCLAFFALGVMGGGIMVWVVLQDRHDHLVDAEAEEKFQGYLRARRRNLAENGRSYPRHPDAKGAARVTKARTRQARRKL